MVTKEHFGIRWELVRRNEFYKEEYRLFVERNARVLNWIKTETSMDFPWIFDRDSIFNEMKTELLRSYADEYNKMLTEGYQFFDRWGFLPVNPEFSADHAVLLHNNQINSRRLVGSVTPIGWNIEQDILDKFKRFILLRDRGYIPKYPALIVAIDPYYSNQEILEEVSAFLNIVRENHSNEILVKYLQEAKLPGRRHQDIEQYKKYLKVWDVKKEKECYVRLQKVLDKYGLKLRDGF